MSFVLSVRTDLEPRDLADVLHRVALLVSDGHTTSFVTGEDRGIVATFQTIDASL